MCRHRATTIILAVLSVFASAFFADAADLAAAATEVAPSEEELRAAVALSSADADQSSSSSEVKRTEPQGVHVAKGAEANPEAPPPPKPAPAAATAKSPAKPPFTYSNNSKDVTFTPGVRLQVRYIHDTTSNNDEFFVARLRLKAKGELFHTVRYYAELKADTLGRSGKNPTIEMENAWVEYSVTPYLALRGGLYDVPFSRNALTSDSKLLLVDRSLIKDQLTSFGFADNTTGLLGHGRPFKGHFEYSVGLFNNEKFRAIGAPGANHSTSMMPAGRFVYHFLEPAPRGGYADYQSSYVGKGNRLSIGANTAYLRKARDTAGSQFHLLGWGTDLFFSTGPFSFEAEYDQLRKQLIGGSPEVQMDGWYAQAGYLFWRRFEFAVRHQELDPNVAIPANRLRWTSLGSNIYFRKHNVKLQLDYTFRRGLGQPVKTDVLQIQMQVDY